MLDEDRSQYLTLSQNLDEDTCPTSSMLVDEKDQATATAEFRLEGVPEQITAPIFRNTVKSAYTQLFPRCSLPTDAAVLYDEIFYQHPKAVSCVINPANILLGSQLCKVC